MSAHDALDRLHVVEICGVDDCEQCAALTTVRERLDTLTGQVEQLTQERDEERRATASFDAFMQDIAAVEQANARAEAAEAENARLTEGLRENGEPIMDERFRDRLLRHVLSNEEVGQLVDAIESREARARALLAASSPPPGDTEGWPLDRVHPTVGIYQGGSTPASPTDGGGA